MATRDRDRMGEVSEFLLLVGERLVDAAYRVRVEAIKAIRIGRLRMEMAMLRRERRAAILRLGEATLTAVQENRVTDPMLAACAREVDDVNTAVEAKAHEAARIADLPDDAVVRRGRDRVVEEGAEPVKEEEAKLELAAPAEGNGLVDRPIGAIPVTKRGAAKRDAMKRDAAKRDPLDVPEE